MIISTYKYLVSALNFLQRYKNTRLDACCFHLYGVIIVDKIYLHVSPVINNTFYFDRIIKVRKFIYFYRHSFYFSTKNLSRSFQNLSS